jgi:hypothetical protein
MIRSAEQKIIKNKIKNSHEFLFYPGSLEMACNKTYPSQLTYTPN